jgi:hypothetical protein
MNFLAAMGTVTGSETGIQIYKNTKKGPKYLTTVAAWAVKRHQNGHIHFEGRRWYVAPCLIQQFLLEKCKVEDWITTREWVDNLRECPVGIGHKK